MDELRSTGPRCPAEVRTAGRYERTRMIAGVGGMVSGHPAVIAASFAKVADPRGMALIRDPRVRFGRKIRALPGGDYTVRELHPRRPECRSR